MTSEGGIFLVFQWGCGKNCEIGQNRPRNGQKSDILAIFGLWEALKTPYRCDLKSKLVELLMGHNLKAFRAKKIGPGWRGRSGMAEISQNITFALWVGHFWWKTHFFHFFRWFSITIIHFPLIVYQIMACHLNYCYINRYSWCWPPT